MTGTPVSQQVLIYGDKSLADDELLSDVGIDIGSTVHMVLKLRGGGETRESNGYQMMSSKFPGVSRCDPHLIRTITCDHCFHHKSIYSSAAHRHPTFLGFRDQAGY